jgi:hypothetical protein
MAHGHRDDTRRRLSQWYEHPRGSTAFVECGSQIVNNTNHLTPRFTGCQITDPDAAPDGVTIKVQLGKPCVDDRNRSAVHRIPFVENPAARGVDCKRFKERRGNESERRGRKICMLRVWHSVYRERPSTGRLAG